MSNYCFTDIHGMYDLWEQIKNYTKPTDKLFFLGDAMDRGYDGIKILTELLADPRVIFIKGNHEEIFETCAQQYLMSYNFEDSIYLWLINGGEYSFSDFRKLNINDKCDLINKVKALPDHMIFKSKKGHKVFLCHSGTGIHYDNADKLLIPGNQYLWDRHHFNEKWGTDKENENLYMVHGHTPVHYIKPALGINLVPKHDNLGLPDILNYADGHKFNLDLAAFETKKIALFNLDELKVEKYFYTREGYDG